MEDLMKDDAGAIKSNHDGLSEFKKDLQLGFIKKPKQIPSQYFYDERGSELFNQITRHPDYYLTQCEIEILNNHKKTISNLMGQEAFNLVELGPGEGIKTKLLLEQFLGDALKFRYTPIDISMKYLECLVTTLNHEMSALAVTPLHADYFKGLEWQSEHSLRRNLVLFLGSSIGNFTPEMTDDFLTRLWQVLHADDYVLLGFDLKKDVQILMRAYDDDDGITEAFNLNLLRRINEELAGHFDLTKFRHQAVYNEQVGAMESYLVSQKAHQVMIDVLNKTYSFAALEPIHVESSYKYQLPQLERMAKNNGFELIDNFLDSRHYFVNSLWRVNK